MKQLSEAQLKQRSNAGKIGGSVKTAKGFAKMDKDRLLEITSKGGKRSGESRRLKMAAEMQEA